jgi:hypothetical protein
LTEEVNWDAEIEGEEEEEETRKM